MWLKRYPEHYGAFLSDAEIGWQKGNRGVYVFNAPDSIGRRRLEYTGQCDPVAKAVENRFASIHLYAEQRVRVSAHYHLGARIDRSVRQFGLVVQNLRRAGSSYVICHDNGVVRLACCANIPTR